MTKTLFLFRHGKAENAQGTMTDFDRPLAPKGKYDTPRMGQVILNKGYKPQLIVASPAERTALSANYLMENFDLNEEKLRHNQELYEASTRVLMREINALSDDFDTVMLVGHNPSLSYFSEYVTGKEIGHIPTAGCVGLQFELASWQMIAEDTATLLFFETPESNDIKY